MTARSTAGRRREGPATPRRASLSPFDQLREVFPGDAAGGALLLACAALALVWANSPWAGSYFSLLQRTFAVGAGTYRLELSLLHWINDLLMAVFFLEVGLEIKRERLVGELMDAKQAALPIAGALGGMVVPAGIYAALNAGGPGAHGWGIPMATDIAFSLGVLALLGERVPRGLTVFLTALAIVDDLGAVLVIALFYTGGFALGALLGALALAGLLVIVARLGVRRLWPFLAAAPVLWLLMHASGVHSTIAGVLLGWTIPLGSAGQAGHLGSPLETLERALKPWVKWLVMPLFALANAGVALSGPGPAALATPVAAGVALGLLVGKPLGIFGLSWLAIRSGLARLPSGASRRTLFGVALLGGIGFTVALFVASLSFPTRALGDLAKVGILSGSLAAGLIGSLFLGRAVAGGRSVAAGRLP